ncbi:MAG: DUF1214 domain-containing protein, partial [Myxococcales bacterium]|nr:DUF1214 domain-containing protein [Myxococcales bacterium]
ALEELRAVTRELEAAFHGQWWQVADADDEAEARRFVLHTLQHALEVWLEGDPERPVFKRFVTPEKKLLGDNPDAWYFNALVDPAREYRIRGNLAGATYTSFTVEVGTGDGGMSRKIGGALNDTQFDAAPNGDFELRVSATRPASGERNWLRLVPGAGSISTRHYYEREVSIAADRLHHIPLVIERVDDPGPPPPPSDASVARGIRRVANFLRHNSLPPINDRPKPSFVSTVPNRFNPVVRDAGNQEIGFAAVDNTYAQTTVRLAPDEALVVRGRFPKCRFANVVLWNRYLQTLDYAHRRCSLNRKQVRYRPDGSFEVVVAHRDPGVPNWLDMEGRREGTMFWRFQLAEEDIAPLEAKVVKLADVAKA